MANKRNFYDEHGVEEYYVYDPETDDLFIYLRAPHRAALRREYFKDGFTSPRLKIRFDTTGDELRVFYPDGRPFLTFEDLATLQERESARADKAEARASNAEAANHRLARIVELLTKAASGPLPPDELAELEALRRAQ